MRKPTHSPAPAAGRGRGTPEARASAPPVAKAPPGTLVVNGYSERWLRQGFPWVYPNEVVAGSAAAGAVVGLRSAGGDDLGVAITDDGWIRARRFRSSAGKIDADVILERLRGAWVLRRALGLGDGETTCFRWVNGENDDMPGVRVDVWGDHVVISLDSPSLVQLIPMLVAGIRAVLHAVQSVHVGWRPDVRDGRVWPAAPGRVYGDPPGAVIVWEHGVRYRVEPASRKDIGLFPDQRDNRAWLAPYYVGTRVLNLFCYTGAFSVHALVHGAAEVVSVDLSKVYLDQLEENLVLNGVAAGPPVGEVPKAAGPPVGEVPAAPTSPLRGEVPAAPSSLRGEVPAAPSSLRGEVPAAPSSPLRGEVPKAEGGHEAVPEDALKVLDRYRRQGRVFDRIILDPPGHSHSAEGDWSGEQDYARLVAAAARVCAPGGWLIASSNLGSVSPRQFQGALVDGLRKANCQGRVIHTGGQAADFPSALHFPEGTFLKFVVIEVQRA